MYLVRLPSLDEDITEATCYCLGTSDDQRSMGRTIR